MSFSMRPCTARIACSRVVHSSNSEVSASTRLIIRRTLALFLPRRPRSSSVCSASWRRASPMWRGTWFSICCAPSCDDLLEHLAALRQQLRAERGLEEWAAGSRSAPTSSPSTRAASACRAESGNTRSRSTSRVRAVSRCCWAICASTCSSVASGSTSESILLRTMKRVGAWAPRWSRQIARSDLVTPVSAPRMNTVACAEGSRVSVSSGSAPIAFRPGVSRTTRPWRSSGCG